MQQFKFSPLLILLPALLAGCNGSDNSAPSGDRQSGGAREALEFTVVEYAPASFAAGDHSQFYRAALDIAYLSHYLHAPSGLLELEFFDPGVSNLIADPALPVGEWQVNIACASMDMTMRLETQLSSRFKAAMPYYDDDDDLADSPFCNYQASNPTPMVGGEFERVLGPGDSHEVELVLSQALISRQGVQRIEVEKGHIDLFDEVYTDGTRVVRTFDRLAAQVHALGEPVPSYLDGKLGLAIYRDRLDLTEVADSALRFRFLQLRSSALPAFDFLPIAMELSGFDLTKGRDCPGQFFCTDETHLNGSGTLGGPATGAQFRFKIAESAPVAIAGSFGSWPRLQAGQVTITDDNGTSATVVFTDDGITVNAGNATTSRTWGSVCTDSSTGC